MPATFNEEARTVTLRWTTGAEVRREHWFDGPFIERLDTSTSSVRLDRLNAGASLLDSHNGYGLSSVLGVVERAWMEGGEGYASVRFSSREDVEPIFRDVKDGIIRNVSVGYKVHKSERDVGANPPIVTMTDWEPYELSLVAIPADPGAQVRSETTTPTQRDMSTNTPKAGADPAVQEQETETRALEAPATPTPTPQPAAAVAEVERSLQELRRENRILDMARKANLSDEQTRSLIDSGKPVDQVAVDLFTMVRDGMSQSKAGHPVLQAQLEVTRDQGDTLMRGIEDALTARVMPGQKLSDLGRDYRGYTLLEYARMYLESRGVNTRGMSKTDLVVRGFHSTSDFPLLFSNLAGKSLDAAYMEEPHTWRAIARQRNLPDFKLASDLIVADSLTPEALLEGGEYKSGTLVEAQHQWRLATYAKKVSVTRQAIINDDLSALERIPEMLGRGFRRLESNLVWALITGNAVTSVDGQALFHASHNNTPGSGQSINTAGINALRKLMRKQTDVAGNTINLTPSYMLVPTDLEATALQFLFPNGFMSNTRTGDNGPVTVQSAGIELIVEPRLDGAASVFYLAAAPTSVEGIVYGYLAGEEGPTVTTTEKRDPDGVELLARFDFGCAVKDYRFITRSAAV